MLLTQVLDLKDNGEYEKAARQVANIKILPGVSLHPSTIVAPVGDIDETKINKRTVTQQELDG